LFASQQSFSGFFWTALLQQIYTSSKFWKRKERRQKRKINVAVNPAGRVGEAINGEAKKSPASVILSV